MMIKDEIHPRQAWRAPCSRFPLRLANYRRMRTDFGYLLRHYWMPNTTLTFKITKEQTFPQSPTMKSEAWVERKMLKCDADQCVWHEKILKQSPEPTGWFHTCKPQTEESVHTYNRSEQTYRSYDFEKCRSLPEFDDDAGNEAFLRQPILTPLMPIPVGFEWHVSNKESYLDYKLDSVEQHNGMTLLLVRRKGRINLFQVYLSGRAFVLPYTIDREGITLYHLERSMILEDRVCDRFQPFDNSSADALEIRTTTQWIQSELK